MKLSDFCNILYTKDPNFKTKFYCPFNKTYYYISATSISSKGFIRLTDNYNERLSVYDNLYVLLSDVNELIQITQDRKFVFVYKGNEFKLK